MDIAEFLRARLDEDEREAKRCAEMFPPPWETADRGWRVRIYSSEVPEEGDHAEPGWVRHPVVMEVEPDRHIDDPLWLSERVEHVRRHDPARVLREVEAKRRIVDLGWHHLGDEEYGWGMEEAKRQVLRIMATAYADHPDYDPDWV